VLRKQILTFGVKILFHGIFQEEICLRQEMWNLCSDWTNSGSLRTG